MFAHLTTAQRNQHVEVCRYFFRANVMKKLLDALVEKHGSPVHAVEIEWDEFWAYYCFWLSGLWVACEGMERIKFGDEDTIAEAKRGLHLLHPVRQATFHYKPSTKDMMRHFDAHETPLNDPWLLHDNIANAVARFLESLPQEYLESMGGE